MQSALIICVAQRHVDRESCLSKPLLSLSERRPLSAAQCFHCGLPVPAGTVFNVVANGQSHALCCAGCEAVASAILGQGLGDYYQLRQTVSERGPSLPSADDLTIYDNPDVQKTFVRRVDGACEAELLLEGIRCSACVWLNEQVISRMPGVRSVLINYATHRAHVRWDPQMARLSEILGAIRAIGYGVHPYDPRRVELVHREEQRQAIGRLFVAGFGMMQVMMYAVPVYLAETGDMTWDIEQLFRWAGLALTLPVMLYSAVPFFRGAYRHLKHGQLGMDVPVVLGLSIAFGASLFGTVTGGGEVYYDSISMFVFLLLLGRYLELIARQRASRAIRHLGRIVPEFAERMPAFPASSASERVAAGILLPGEHVLVGTGQQIPADGVVARGEGFVDESLLSGEPRPISRRPGDMLVGGSVNLSSPLIMRVTRVGTETVLSGILRLVERAAGEKHEIAIMADRATGFFILSVLVLSAAAAFYWGMADPGKAIWVTVSVLVATCPCAFSLATPVAITAATGELARRGFVVTRAHAVEVLGRATDIVFDKTGTLTRGDLRMTSLVPEHGYSREQCLQIATAMESGAAHPIAAAISDAARRSGVAGAGVDDIKVTPGQGIEALVGENRYRIGTPGFVAPWNEVGALVSATVDSDTVLLAGEAGMLATMRFGDEVRPDAARAVSELKRMGLTPHLLTGDAEAPAHRVAKEVGIELVAARALPPDKHGYVRSLQRGGAVVAMVGDGINDAPVLAQADISIAMGSGAYMAQVQAGAVLLSGRLEDLAWAAGHARKTLHVIRQNIAWAFAYNLSVLPLALAGVVTPWMAAAGMSVSSLLVVLNALRLVSGDGEKVKGTGPRPGLAVD